MFGILIWVIVIQVYTHVGFIKLYSKICAFYYMCFNIKKGNNYQNDNVISDEVD